MMAVERLVSKRGITVACFLSVSLATVSLMTASLVPSLLVTFVILQGSGHGVTSIMNPLIIGDILARANFGAVSGSQAMIFKLSIAMARFVDRTSDGEGKSVDVRLGLVGRRSLKTNTTSKKEA